jgi:hypothetical protein
MGIMFRVSVNRSRALAAMQPAMAMAPGFQRHAGPDICSPAAAATLDTLLWPTEDPIVPIGKGVPNRRPLPTAPQPEPVTAGAFSRSFEKVPRRRDELERVQSPADPDSADEFVFEAIVPVRKS